MDINYDDNSINKKMAETYAAENTGLTVFPNPIRDVLKVQSELGINSIRFFDVSGKLLLSIPYEAEDAVEINLDDFPDGMYFMEVHEVGNQLSTTKVVKQ